MVFSIFKVSPPEERDIYYSITAMTIETSHNSLHLDSKLIGNLAFSVSKKPIKLISQLIPASVKQKTLVYFVLRCNL